MANEPHEPDETTGAIAPHDEPTAAMPVPEPEPEPEPEPIERGGGGGGRRRSVMVVAAAAIAILAAVVTLVVLAGGSDDDTTTSASTTVATTTTSEATTSSTRMTTTTETTTPSTLPTTTAAPAGTNPPATTVPAGPELPHDPNAYAAAAFRAWQQGDDATLELLTSPDALAVLTARAPGTGDWTGPTCDGAAGSIYCAWTGPEDQLVLRVATEEASTGQAHAVHEARFQDTPS